MNVIYWLQFQFSGLICQDSLTLQFAQYELDNKANGLEIRQEVSETDHFIQYTSILKVFGF